MKLLQFVFLSTLVAFALPNKITGSGLTTKPSSPTDKEDDPRAQFAKWKRENNKTYTSNDNEEKVQKIYAQNLKSIQAHNKRKNETYVRGPNSHSDMTYEEKQAKRMGIKQPPNIKNTKLVQNIRTKRDDQPLPDSVDYRPLLTPVKDQGNCGACFAFSANAVLEYQMNEIKRLSIPLSEQEIIDCDTYDNGCDGGWPLKAFGYMTENGITSSKNYRFVGKKQKCMSKRYSRVSKISDACQASLKGDDEAMKYVVANYGVVAAVLWSTDSFTSYKSGVYYEANCRQDEPNHGVAIVGYGTDPKFGDYWLVKNSWGKSWGIEGYGKIKRGQNTCGIANFAIFPCNTNV